MGDILRSRISVLPIKSNKHPIRFDHSPVHLMQYLLCTICFADIMILLQILYFFKYIFVMASQFVNISCLPSRIHISKKGLNVNEHEASPLYTSDTN